MPDIPLSINKIFGPDGLLAGSLEGFEFRPSQMQMSLLIEEALQKKIPAIVEAGTGTGKTFGYLIPVILSGKKTVISTGTKNLQEQIYAKDIPLLRRATSLNIDAMIMKGRKNYLCLFRYHQYFSQQSLLKTGMEETRKKIDAWLKRTEFADREELSWMADADMLWDSISSTSDQCLGTGCMFIDDCFLSKLRSKAAKSRIIIVNHHLFFADMKVKKGGFGEIIPRFQVALFDEAHNIEEIATSFLGESLSTNQLMELARDLEKGFKKRRGFNKSGLKKAIFALRSGSEHISNLFADYKDKDRLDENTLSGIMQGPARNISQALRNIQEKVSIEEIDDTADQAISARAGELDKLLKEVLTIRDDGWLNWYEKRKKSLVLYHSPLDISGPMNDLLYKKAQTVLFTSATLSTNGNFDYIRSRLGLRDEVIESIYPSHFDFKKQAIMYIPKDLPRPDTRDFGPAVAERICDILKKTEGRALVLFTSYHNLNIVYQIIKDHIPYTIFRQGDAPRSVLLEEFKKDIHSVLLATGSFWQGVDVPGETLSCLIIDKLPFASPDEPLVGARIRIISEREGNPFMEYQVPSAIISLKQGLGRLIRKTTDRGILSVLDVRIKSTRYGRFFLESLPDIPISHDIKDISRFFEKT